MEGGFNARAGKTEKEREDKIIYGEGAREDTFEVEMSPGVYSIIAELARVILIQRSNSDPA